MKSLMVVSQLNDPFYIDYDGEFAKYIIDRAKGSGLIEEGANVTELEANLVMQFFSPLVLSQRLLVDQTKEPCSSILCPNGFIFAFKQTDDLLFIAVNGDRTESELFLHRKLQVFMTIMRFIFGPSCEEMSQSQSYSKKGKWDFLHQLMQNWTELVHSEQAYLVEAIERVHVNQMVNEKCMEILLKSVKQFQGKKDLPTHHALLLVNSKLLAFYSDRSANELRPKDLLMAMLLSKTFHPQADKLEDLFSTFYISSKYQEESSIIADDISDAGEDEYHSAPNSPRSHRSRSPTSKNKSETVKHADSSDQDSIGENLAESLSLLDLFKEKCPDVVFTKETDKNEDKLSIKDEHVTALKDTDTKLQPHTINVEAVVHQDADSTSHPLEHEASCVQISQKSINPVDDLENKCNLDCIHPDLKNGNDCNTYPASGKVDQKSNVGQSTETNSPSQVSAETMETVNEENNVSNESNVHLLGMKTIGNELFTSEEKTVVSRHVAVPSSLSLAVNHDNLQSHTEDRSTVGISSRPVANSTVQFSSTHHQPNEKLSPYGNSFSGGIPVTNRSHLSKDNSGSNHSSPVVPRGKSRSSTPPHQSTQPDLRFQSSLGTMWSKSEILNNDSTAATRRINTAMGNTKPVSGMHNGANVARKSPTESSSVTIETGSNASAFSSTSSSGVYLPQTVFLETSTCLYSPYNVYTVQISPGLTLVLLSQAPRYSLADSLYQVIQTIQDVMYGRRSKLPRSRSIYVYDTINVQLGRIHNSLKKVTGRMKTLISDVQNRWEKEDLKYKLLDFLEKDSAVRLPQELESSLMELYKKLRELFSRLFLSPVHCTSQLWDSLAQIRASIRAELLDYREYLNVKAQRNITMTSYIDEFPGLVHFIFIDRHFHQMTAPSLNISLKAGESIDATSYLKEKIWTMYQHMMSKLTDGYTSVMMRDGDFYFSYFLWFEDYTGNPLPVQESYKPSRKQPYPGILCGQFYKDLLQNCFPSAIQGSIHCNEMFLMHLGTVHPMYIAAHCRKLAYKMWEMSGDIQHSVNLL